MNKLKEGIEKRIKDRLDKLRKGDARRALAGDPAILAVHKEKAKRDIESALKSIVYNLPNIINLHMKLRKTFDHIWEQNCFTASYLLVGKAIKDLQVSLLLAKEGYSQEMVEIARSGVETLDLAMLFMENGQEEKLNKWFKGEIIENKHAREKMGEVLNEYNKAVNQSSEHIPIMEAKTDIYGIYSLYTHSGYSALLDLIDVFHEDFDYNQSSGYHYSNQYMHLIENLAVNILLELKNVFGKVKDAEGLKTANELLKAMGYENATQREINNIFTAYKNNPDDLRKH